MRRLVRQVTKHRTAGTVLLSGGQQSGEAINLGGLFVGERYHGTVRRLVRQVTKHRTAGTLGEAR